MKKGVVISIFLVLISFLAHAQDYIISKKGEKIDCKIQKIDSVNIYFSAIMRGQSVNSMIAREDIREYGSYSKFNSSQAEKFMAEKTSTRLSFFGGGGYLLSSISNISSYPQSDYMNNLRPGLSYGADISIFPKDIFGIGIKYIIFHSNTSNSVLLYEDNVSITYIGPSISLKKPSPWKPLNFIFGLSLGSFKISNYGSQPGIPWSVDGNSLGGSLDAGMDIKIGEHMALGIDLMVVGGDLNKYTINGSTLKLSNTDYLLRADLTAGLRIYF